MQADILSDWKNFCKTDSDNPREVIRDLLQVDADMFEDAPGVVKGYYKALALGNIYVGYEPYGFAKGVCVSMSGQGCRTYESLGGDFNKLRSRLHADPNVNVTRWDIACDDRSGLLNVETMINSLFNKGLRSHCEKRKIHIDLNGEDIAGSTIYIGSKKSDFFIRIYDKAKETYDPVRQPELYNSPWVRVELVLKKQYAQNALDQMENRDDLGLFVAEMINGHMAFIERDDSNISRCSLISWWSEFLECLESVKIWSKGEIKHSFDKSLEWVRKQYGPVLAMLYKGLGSLRFYSEIIYDGKDRMTDRHNSLLSDYRKRRPVLAAEPCCS